MKQDTFERPKETPGRIERGGPRILTYTTLYPNAVRPGHGVFVENRLRKLVSDGRVAARVMAPVPWFPSTSTRFGVYGGYARVPARETRHGIDIDHPRYPTIPRIGTGITTSTAPSRTTATRALISVVIAARPSVQFHRTTSRSDTQTHK